MRRLAMIMAAALAISGVETTKAAAPAISRVATTNTSWWRLALAAPAIAPDFALLSKRDVISEAAVFLRDVDGLGDGFAPSLYCHERDWLHAGKQRVTGEEIAGVQIAARWRTGDAVFRDHFECFVAPPLDEWFGFDALPPADDPAWERRAVAETSRRRPRRFVDCGAADGELRVVVHVRLGDLIHPDLSVNASATALASISMRSQGGHLRNALRVVAELRARLPGRRVHTLILSDSPPETVAASLEGLDVGIHVGGARGDGASHLVDGRTAGLETDFDRFVYLVDEFRERGTWRAFLWTVVREPLARGVSAFFHFEATKHRGNHSDANVVAYLESEGNFLWNYLRTNKRSAPRPGDVDELLDVYDLVGTTELFDETMVVLATRLGVPLGDVLSPCIDAGLARDAG
ncbi:sulfotransferase family [Aureococcus anophagefferens]|nr:sulfotransferase family [Aureococcus anophagefferens]